MDPAGPGGSTGAPRYWPEQHWGPPPQQWGPPPTGPPPAPRRRARRVLVVVVLVLLLGVLVLVALLAFVLGPRFARVEVLDAPAVERGVTEVLTRDWRRAVSGVGCPEGVRARAGESFRCTAIVDGRPRGVPVDVLDDRGTYQVGQPR